MNKIIASIALVSTLAVSATDANALGRREEGVLIGIGSTLILQGVFNRDRGPVTYPQDGGWGRTNRNGQFPPFRCTGSEVDCAYERGVWERKRQEWEDMKAEAYLCGRYPDRAECSR